MTTPITCFQCGGSSGLQLMQMRPADGVPPWPQSSCCQIVDDGDLACRIHFFFAERAALEEPDAHRLDDAVIRNLWKGTGKPSGTDQSRTGYGYTLTRALVRHGYTDSNDLATILTLRPNGGVAHGKGSDYVARTVTKIVGRK